MLPEIHVKCLVDNFFTWTTAANSFFVNNKFLKKVIIGTCAGLLDLALLAQLYIWITKGKTWRYPLAVTMMYIIHLYLGAVYKMSYPYGYIWEFPGMYSFTVTYGVYNSFYFSQTLALGVIHFFEFREQGYRKL